MGSLSRTSFEGRVVVLDCCGRRCCWKLLLRVVVWVALEIVVVDDCYVKDCSCGS